MNVFPKTPSLGGSRPLRLALHGPDVSSAGSGLRRRRFRTRRRASSAWEAFRPIYNGKYVLQKTDFGFLWLDTDVSAWPASCRWRPSAARGNPASDTSIYVIGDCSGISSVFHEWQCRSGEAVLGTVRRRDARGCNSARRVNGTGLLLLRPRDLANTRAGTLRDITDSTQTADSQGRTWTVQSAGHRRKKLHVWKASGNPNGPPTGRRHGDKPFGRGPRGQDELLRRQVADSRTPPRRAARSSDSTGTQLQGDLCRRRDRGSRRRRNGHGLLPL